MMQRESLSEELSAEWSARHSEQLDLRRQLAANPDPAVRATLMERFRANREALAAIERGERPPAAASPAEGPTIDRVDDPDPGGTDPDVAARSSADPANGDPAGVDLDSADLDATDLDTTDPDSTDLDEADLADADQLAPTQLSKEIVPVRRSIEHVPQLASSSGVQIGLGYAALVGLVAVIVAVGGVIVVGNGLSQNDEDAAGRAGNGAPNQLQSSSGGVDVEVELLRTRIEELGISGIAIDVDAERSVVVLAGTVASEAERQELLAAARATIVDAELDTEGITLAGAGSAPAATTETAAAAPLRRVALIVPDTRTDLSFSQSMVESIEAIAAERGSVELTLVEQARGADAVNAIRQYATEGFDLVIAHSSGFRPAVDTVAAEHPDVVFAVGTIVDEPTLPNVYTYNVAVEDGGLILGAAAARATTTGTIGIVGPVAVGTSKRYLDAFEAGVEAEAPGTTVLVTYTGSLNDPAAAAAATQALIDAGADVIAGQGHYLTDAVAAAEAAGVLWIGNHVDQNQLAPSTVLASQVYRWDVVLAQIIADLDAGLVDGRNLTADLANGGLTIEVNPGTSRGEQIAPLVDELVTAAGG